MEPEAPGVDRSANGMKLYSEYSQQDAINAAADDGSSRSRREGCFVAAGGQMLAFFELSDAPNDTALTSAYELRWQPGVLPASLQERESRPTIHGLVKPPGDSHFIYVGQVEVSWSCQSSDPAQSYVHFQLATPLSTEIAPRVGIRSPWTLRLVSEAIVDGERELLSCCESVAGETDLERLLAIANEKDDVEIFLKHFFTLCEINVNLNAAEQGVVAYMKEDDSDGKDCFFEYSRGTMTADEGEIDFYDCSPAGCFVPIPIPAANVVPRSRALDAVREYYRTGLRPTCVEWGDYAW